MGGKRGIGTLGGFCSAIVDVSENPTLKNISGGRTDEKQEGEGERRRDEHIPLVSSIGPLQNIDDLFFLQTISDSFAKYY